MFCLITGRASRRTNKGQNGQDLGMRNKSTSAAAQKVTSKWAIPRHGRISPVETCPGHGAMLRIPAASLSGEQSELSHGRIPVSCVRLMCTDITGSRSCRIWWRTETSKKILNLALKVPPFHTGFPEFKPQLHPSVPTSCCCRIWEAVGHGSRNSVSTTSMGSLVGVPRHCSLLHLRGHDRALGRDISSSPSKSGNSISRCRKEQWQWHGRNSSSLSLALVCL